jgi:DNA-directed RNA polymerase subunit F
MEESFVSLTELKVILDKEKAARGELNPEQQYSLSHASLFSRVPADKVPAIVKELMEIPMMSSFNAVKIVDVMPTNMDDVRAIFAKERFALSKEDAEKVLEIVGKYR